VTVLLAAVLLAYSWAVQPGARRRTDSACRADGRRVVRPGCPGQIGQAGPIGPAHCADAGCLAPNLIISVLVLVSGVHAGLYVLVAPMLIALAGGVTSAWLLLTRVGQ
jgi:hypothetical protein